MSLFLGRNLRIEETKLDFYRAFLGPALNALEPEIAHAVALFALKCNLVPVPSVVDDPILHTEAWGKRFSNPLGLAAGFDKNCEVPVNLIKLGFGFVEIGTVTPEPQAGNARPRMFRLTEDCAIINRLGFNSKGINHVSKRLTALKTTNAGQIIGVNIGMNRNTEDPIGDYVSGVHAFKESADYLVVNVSSPNTPGLRDLQSKASLTALLRAVNDAQRNPPNSGGLPILIKISPDLTPSEIADIVGVATACDVDGIIATNTTISRPANLKSARVRESGGLSGRPLMDASNRVLNEVFRQTSGKMTLIGAGGVFSGADAYVKIRAGASLIQLYTGMIFRGPWIAAKVRAELAELLKRDGYSSVGEAVGTDIR